MRVLPARLSCCLSDGVDISGDFQGTSSYFALGKMCESSFVIF